MEGTEYVRSAPPPAIVDVGATLELGADEPNREPLADDGSSRPLTSTSLHVRFDRYMDPRTLIRQAYCLRSDQADVPGFEDCVGGLGSSPRYDPVTRTLAIYLEERLAPDTLYKLTLLAPREGADVGLRAFDGVPLETSVVRAFRTLDDPATLPELEAPPLDADAPDCYQLFIGPGTSFEGKCSNCHQAPGDDTGDLIAAPMGLSLEKEHPSGMIGRAAHEKQMGNDANTAQQRAARFGTNMPLVDPGNPGNSYLLYKVLARTRGSTPLKKGETERLLSSLVVGMPMPAVGQVVEDAGVDVPMPIALTEDEVKALSTWIAAGAPCPPLVPGE